MGSPIPVINGGRKKNRLKVRVKTIKILKVVIIHTERVVFGSINVTTNQKM